LEIKTEHHTINTFCENLKTHTKMVPGKCEEAQNKYQYPSASFNNYCRQNVQCHVLETACYF